MVGKGIVPTLFYGDLSRRERGIKRFISLCLTLPLLATILEPAQEGVFSP